MGRRLEVFEVARSTSRTRKAGHETEVDFEQRKLRKEKVTSTIARRKEEGQEGRGETEFRI
jgi:hypothetical protein